jgi:hypothetical protein
MALFPTNEVISMHRPSLELAVEKLAVAGEQAGFSVEEMIDLLNGGLPVSALLDMISSRLQEETQRSQDPYPPLWVQ